MVAKYYGKRRELQVVNRVPFMWRVLTVVCQIIACREAVKTYTRLKGCANPALDVEYEELILLNKEREKLLLDRFAFKLMNPDGCPLAVQYIGAGVYQLVRMRVLCSELRVGMLSIIKVGTKEECEKLMELINAN